MTVLEQWGSYVARGPRESLPDPLRTTLRLHMTDTIGAWIAGCGTAEGQTLIAAQNNFRERFGSKSIAEEALDRIMMNCALARLSEIDDIHLPSCTTPGSLIVPSALTVGGWLGSGCSEIAKAMVIGYEAMTRLSAALKGPSILYRGIWPTYFTAPFGVAAVTARLLGLSERQAAHALGIALIVASPGVGRQSGLTTSRWLALGQAARNGASAALSAQAGFTADLKILEGDFFRSIFDIPPDLIMLADGLGRSPLLADVSFKPWCAARQTMAACQALKEIIRSGAYPTDMTELVVSVPAPYRRMIDHGIVAGDRASHMTSVAYQMALAAFEPQAMLDVNQSPKNVSEQVRAFMAKVTVEADDSLLQYYPKAWPARLTVRTRSEQHEKVLIHVPGDPARPFEEKDVIEKFRSIVTPLIGARFAEELAGRSLAALEDGSQPLLALIERARTVATVEPHRAAADTSP